MTAAAAAAVVVVAARRLSWPWPVQQGALALLGCFCNIVSALVLRLNYDSIRTGLYAYNGVLVRLTASSVASVSTGGGGGGGGGRSAARRRRRAASHDLQTCAAPAS